MIVRGAISRTLAVKVLQQFDKSIKDVVERLVRTQSDARPFEYRDYEAQWMSSVQNAIIHINNNDVERAGRRKNLATESGSDNFRDGV
ncbi:hypothetical protein R1flu_026564 [Riccia fluitans]|uniref:Uncharacterized protein n=1 Tax=Riccia fluitans TaxID=41844 RepID=A0ABD1XJ96_9MARC